MVRIAIDIATQPDGQTAIDLSLAKDGPVTFAEEQLLTFLYPRIGAMAERAGENNPGRVIFRYERQ